jgi:hypothetical protein
MGRHVCRRSSSDGILGLLGWLYGEVGLIVPRWGRRMKESGGDGITLTRKDTAEYFFKLEQLTHNAGANLEESHHAILQIERGVHPTLFDWLYQSPRLPEGYWGYKERLIAMDKMWWLWEEFCKTSNQPAERLALP